MSESTSSSKLESLLGLDLPKDYKDFINTTGYLCFENIGIEVYGYKTNFDIKKIPCVIAATNLYKEEYRLLDSEIVISHTGFEELIVILDTVTEYVSEIGFSGVRTKVADNFSAWLSNLKLQDALANS